MRKIPLRSCVVSNVVEQHNTIKDELLALIDASDGIPTVDDNNITNITKCDWTLGKNFERIWVQYFRVHFINALKPMINELGYSAFNVTHLWYQQYNTHSAHDWHIHGENFTGVYYLEMPFTAPQTQILEPYNNNVIDLDVKEGDIVIFPSCTIHRAPINQSKERKTIISFNFNVQMQSGVIPVPVQQVSYPVPMWP